VPDESLEFASYGPFELLQARQLIESNIAEFAATQVTKQDIMKLMEIQENARKEKCFRDSEWDLAVPRSGCAGNANTALAAIVEKCGLSAFTTRTGRNCTITSICAPSITGVTITIKFLKR
jgi:GntR family hexuronate regulon transcriptional repressor